MKKRFVLFLTMIVLFAFSIVIVKAANPTNNSDLIDIVEHGTEDAVAHGTVAIEVEEVQHIPNGVPNNTSNKKEKLTLSVDPGYYASNLTVKLGETALTLGFEAGAEQGNFFREIPFYPLESYYEFYIPTAANNTDNKVLVDVYYAEKPAINITYQVKNGGNYGEEKVLVEGYKDGDIVMPEECTGVECKVSFKFGTEEVYTEYKTSIQKEEAPDPAEPWYHADRFGLEAGNCDDTNYVCTTTVLEEFEGTMYGTIHLGFTNIMFFKDKFLGFDAKTNIDNFNDILMETGGDLIGFSTTELNKDVTIFFGTKQLILTGKEPKALVKTGTANVGEVVEFNNVTGNGYGYSVAYDDTKKEAIVSIDSYYQDQMVLELTIKNGDTNVLGDKATISLTRLAFGGNAGALLEVDNLGRNCRDNNNGNTCDSNDDSTIYYSTQYRGILSSFYTEENVAKTTITSVYDVREIAGTVVKFYAENNIEAYARNEHFIPYAIAFFYDADGMVIEDLTRIIDLNAEVPQSGIITKEAFNESYGTYQKQTCDFDGQNCTDLGEVDKDYVYMSHDLHIYPFINQVVYFTHLQDTIMHDVLLIQKSVAKANGVKEIRLFLVNADGVPGGTITKDNLPTLTFGTGKGIKLEIRDEQGNGGGE